MSRQAKVPDKSLLRIMRGLRASFQTSQFWDLGLRTQQNAGIDCSSYQTAAEVTEALVFSFPISGN